MFPTSVNNQITDSVSQANLKVLGDAPAMSMGSLFVATSQALSNAAHNATSLQQQNLETSQAANVQGISTLFGISIGTTGSGTAKIDRVVGLNTLPLGM
jgi:hypothetical protein